MAATANSLYILPLKVERTTEPGCPKATVDWFVGAPDALSALSIAVRQVNRRKLLIVHSSEVERIDPKAWMAFARSRYPSASDHVQNEAEVAKLIETGGFFFVPTSNWEREE